MLGHWSAGLEIVVCCRTRRCSSLGWRLGHSLRGVVALAAHSSLVRRSLGLWPLDFRRTNVTLEDIPSPVHTPLGQQRGTRDARISRTPDISASSHSVQWNRLFPVRGCKGCVGRAEARQGEWEVRSTVTRATRRHLPKRVCVIDTVLTLSLSLLIVPHTYTHAPLRT